MRHEFTINIDYFQFYLEDEGAKADTSVIWNERTSYDRLAVAPGLIAVGTARFMGETQIAIEVQEVRPMGSFEEWDQVAECSINVMSGTIVVYGALENPDYAPRLEIAPGIHRAMVFYGNLDSVKDDARFEGEDHYHIVLGPDEPIDPVIHKRKVEP